LLRFFESVVPNQVADLCAEAVRRLVAGAGVVHRDPGSARKPGAQHITRFEEETVLVLEQQADYLPL
jgi:hypothetical protein